METAGQLHQGGSVTLDANGNGTVTLIPYNANQRWEVTQINVSTSQAPTAIPVPTAEVFVNTSLSRVNSRGASWSGNQDTYEGLVKVGPCDTLNVVFSAGIPGTVASVTVEGTYYTRRGQ